MKVRRKPDPEEVQLFKKKVYAWASTIRVEPKQVRVQMMTRKWASCSTVGRVTFSEDLFQESSVFQDFVVVHELLHLKIPNHGKLFKSLLRAYLPHWKVHSQRLRPRAINAT